MATIARDNVIVEFIAKTAKFKADRNKLLQETERDTKQVSSRFSRIADVAGGVLSANLFTAAASGLASLGAQAIKLSKDYEQTRVSFEVLTGSVENATTLLRDLDKFSLNTPFEPGEINNSAKTLLGFGRSVNEVKEDLEIIGEASAATGADLQNLAVVFGQVAGAGKLQGQDALQLINAGIPVYDLLSQSLNLSTGELKDLQSQGKITFDDLRDAFDQARQEGGKFENALIKQSKTFAGLASTASGAGKSILRNLGDALLPLVREVLPLIITGLFNLVEKAREVAEPLGRFFVGAFRVIANAVKPVTDALFRFFDQFKGGATLLERLQPSLNYLAQALTVVGRVVGFVIDGFSALFSFFSSSDNPIGKFNEVLMTIPAILGGIIRVVQSIPTIFREGFGNAGQVLKDFVEDFATLANPANLARVVTGRTSFADLIAANESRRLAAIADGTRQEYTGFGEEIANAYRVGFDEINNIEFELPDLDTPGNKETANKSGEEIGKEVGKGVGKGLEAQLAANSLEGVKKRLSDLQKELGRVADPAGDGFDRVKELIAEIKDSEADLKQIEGLFARLSGERVDVTVDRIDDAPFERELPEVKLIVTPNIDDDDISEYQAKVKQMANDTAGIATDLANQLLSIQEERLSRDIALQEERLEELLSIADQGNAEQVQLERERLQKLQSERERAVRAQQRLAALEVAANNAVAVAQGIVAITKSFATNPLAGIAAGIGLALTIASTVATLSNAFGEIPSFYDGTEFFKGGNLDSKGGRAAILHPGERVLTAKQNAPLTKWGVSNSQVPELVGLALGRIQTPALSVNAPDDNLRKELAEMRRTQTLLIKELRNNRPSVLFDENGLRVIGANQARREARKRGLRKG